MYKDRQKTEKKDIEKGVLVKEGCNWGHGLSATIKLGTPEAGFFHFGPRLKQNLCLAPDQIMVRPKQVANDQKINLES